METKKIVIILDRPFKPFFLFERGRETINKTIFIYNSKKTCEKRRKIRRRFEKKSEEEIRRRIRKKAKNQNNERKYKTKIREEGEFYDR